jgi:hypothetical protein
VLEDAVDHTSAVEADDDREPAGDGAGGVAALFLHPPHIQLDVGPRCCQRIHAALRAPAQIGAQVGLAVYPGLAPESGEVSRGGEADRVKANWWQDLVSDEGRHHLTIDSSTINVHQLIAKATGDAEIRSMSAGRLCAPNWRVNVLIPQPWIAAGLPGVNTNRPAA